MDGVHAGPQPACLARNETTSSNDADPTICSVQVSSSGKSSVIGDHAVSIKTFDVPPLAGLTGLIAGPRPSVPCAEGDCVVAAAQVDWQHFGGVDAVVVPKVGADAELKLPLRLRAHSRRAAYGGEGVP